MSTCQTCKFWMFDRPDWQFDDLQIGECKKVRKRETVEHDVREELHRADPSFDRYDSRESEAIYDAALKEAYGKAGAIAVDGSGYYAALRTMGDFGCNRHEVKP